MIREISSESAMIALGAEVSATLGAGDVLALAGSLGAGKTHFSKGIVSGLGGDPSLVTSPTFTLVHEYTRGCRVPVYHFDWYRLDASAELLAIGWDDYLDASDGILLVEWADKFPDLLPRDAVWWHFEIAPAGHRVVRSPAR